MRCWASARGGCCPTEPGLNRLHGQNGHAWILTILLILTFLMKTTTKPARAQWSAFGASLLAGLTAGLLWAPASGRHSRTRLATGFRDWTRTATSRWHLWTPRPQARAASNPAHLAPPSDLSMHPERLLTED
jgi:hypothetical protein